MLLQLGNLGLNVDIPSMDHRILLRSIQIGGLSWLLMLLWRLQTCPADLIVVRNRSVHFLRHVAVFYTLNSVSVVETFDGCLRICFDIFKRLLEGFDYEVRHTVPQVVVVVVRLERELASHVAPLTLLILIVS